MVSQESKVIMEVLLVFQVEEDIFADVKLLSGEVDTGMLLEVKGTESRWYVTGLAYISSVTHKKGIRGLTLQGLSGLPLQPGSILQQAST